MADNQEFEIFPLGDWKLQSGEVIPNAHLAFKTFGDPKLPAIVYPTWFSGCRYYPLHTLLALISRVALVDDWIRCSYFGQHLASRRR